MSSEKVSHKPDDFSGLEIDEPKPVQSVPAFLTASNRKKLTALGYPEGVIDAMEPVGALAIIQTDMVFEKPKKPLTEKELRSLKNQGYTKQEHIDALSVDGARRIIANKVYRPGSRAHAKNAIDPMTGQRGGLFKSLDRFTDEAIEERNVGKAEPSGVSVALDEFENDCIRAAQEQNEINRMSA